MKIATYNVNGIRSRLPVLLRWLKESSPDVACLQELKAPQDSFPLQDIQEAGYEAIWHGQKSWNGVAILSKGVEVKEVCRELPGDPEDVHSRYLEAEISGFRLGCLYLPNGNPAPGPKFDYKMSWLERFKTYTAGLLAGEQPCILTGDYNIIPEDRDVYKPERWVKDALFLPEVRAFYHQLLNEGWSDAIRSIHPEETIYTFWDYFRNAYGRNAGLRIDHFLLHPAIKDRLLDVGVDKNVRGWEKSSDHAPVWITLRDS